MKSGFDDSRWPVVTMHFAPQPSDEEWHHLMDCLRESFARGEPFCVIADGSGLHKLPSASQRKIGAAFGEWVKQQPEQLIVAWGNVFSSPLVRGAITAIIWLASPPYPQKNFGTWDEAHAWVKSMHPTLRRG